MDMVWANGTGVFYFVDGMRYTCFSLPMAMSMLWLYSQSRRCGKNWYLYHMMFHLMAATGQCIVIYIKLTVPK